MAGVRLSDVGADPLRAMDGSGQGSTARVAPMPVGFGPDPKTDTATAFSVGAACIAVHTRARTGQSRLGYMSTIYAGSGSASILAILRRSPRLKTTGDRCPTPLLPA